LLLKHASKVALLTLGSVPFITGSARAEENVVMILGSAYFPQKTAVTSGDTVRFVNVSGTTHVVTSKAGLWTTGPIEDGEEIVIRISPDMTGEFAGHARQEIEGQFDFVRAPFNN
jgi:plastocyanin